MTEALHEEIDPHPGPGIGLIIPGNWMMGRHYAVTAHSLTALMVVVDNGAFAVDACSYMPICIALWV